VVLSSFPVCPPSLNHPVSFLGLLTRVLSKAAWNANWGLWKRFKPQKIQASALTEKNSNKLNACIFIYFH
jgi:hypothetical protein